MVSGPGRGATQGRSCLPCSLHEKNRISRFRRYRGHAGSCRYVPNSSAGHRRRCGAAGGVRAHGSTSEHATTPEHPCPGVVARTGPQAVKPSPVSGESMTSGGCALWARLPPPTSPGNATNAAGVTARDGHRPATAGHCGRRPRGAFFPGAAPEPGWRRTQPGPWGRWPTRRCAGEQHLTTDLPENASGAAGVTANGDLRRRKRPRGPPSRGRSLSTYSKSAWPPSAVTSAHRPCQMLHTSW